MAVKVFNSPFRITQEFGVNEDYYKKWGLKGHEGLDVVPTSSDWTIFSLPWKGKVVKDIDMASRGGNYGIFCTIWYPDINEAWQYCHESANKVWVGQDLAPGAPIGTMGSTGNSTGAHLHVNRFEVDSRGYRLNKNNGFMGGIDPLPFLQQTMGEEVVEQVDEYKEEGIRLLDAYRTERVAGPEGNWEGYVNALIANDVRVPVLSGDLASTQLQLKNTIDTHKLEIESVKKVEKELCKEDKLALDKDWQSKVDSAKLTSVKGLEIGELFTILINKIFSREEKGEVTKKK